MAERIDEQFLECCSCRSTPTLRQWMENNAGIEVLGIEPLPEEGFPETEDWEEFQAESGCRMDCPECGTMNCIEDTELY